MAGIKQNLGEASIDIVAKLDKLESGLKKANKTVDRNTKKMQKTVGRLNASFKTLGKTVVGFASIALATGFTRSIVRTAIDFAKAVADLSAITGATGKDLKFFKDQAREIGRTTTKSALEFLQGVKLIASAKPELLEAKEALVAVTKEVVILSEASGLSLPAAADALATSLNQFLAPAEDASRFINVMAAGAKLGSIEIPKLAKVIQKAGTVMSGANLSFEETNAVIQRLGQFKAPAEELGTSLRNIFLELRSGADTTNPKVVGLAKALENLAKETKGITALGLRFGKENAVTAEQLITVAGSAIELTGALTGTQVAYEQAIIQTSGLAGGTERAANAWNELNLSIGEGNGLIDDALSVWADFLLLLAKIPGAFEDSEKGSIAFNKALKEGAVLSEAIRARERAISGESKVGGVAAQLAFDEAVRRGLSPEQAQEISDQARAKFAGGIPVKPKIPTRPPEEEARVTDEQTKNILGLLEKLAEARILTDEKKDEIEDFIRDFAEDLEVVVDEEIADTAAKQAERAAAIFDEFFAQNVISDKSKEAIESGLDEIIEEFVKTDEAIKEATEKEFTDMIQAIESFSRDAARELSDLALAGELSAKKIGQAFARLALNAAFNAFVTKPLEGFFLSILGSIGGKAGGGDIQPNIPVLVGERGPELIVPKMPSTVVNAAGTRGMGAVVNLVQNNHFAVDVKNTVRAEVLNAAPVIAQAAKNATIDALNRQ